MRQVVIAGAARTPMGGFQGLFQDVTAASLGGVALKAALQDARCTAVDEVIMGCVLGAGQGQAPARQAGFAAGFEQRCACHNIKQNVWVGDEGCDDCP